MDRLNQINPFTKRDDHSANTVITYKILTTITWLLSVVVSVVYTFDPPRDGVYLRNRIWDQNYLYPSGFTLNYMITSIYFLVLFILQAGYIGHLFSGKVETVNSAAAVGSHFILNNLLHFAFVMLFVRSHFVWAEVMLILNWANLTMLYFRHNTYPRAIHLPAVSGPLAWTFVAIYWNGAIMVHAPNTLVARVFANIFVWAIAAYGLFFVTVYKDYTMGFCLSVLAASLGVAQFFNKLVALQWIFAFTIMSVLFIATVVIAVPAWASANEGGWFSKKKNNAPPQDAERAPLLADA